MNLARSSYFSALPLAIKNTLFLFLLMLRRHDLSFSGCLDFSYPSLESRLGEYSVYLPLVVNSYATMALNGLCRVTKEVRVSRNPAPWHKASWSPPMSPSKSSRLYMDLSYIMISGLYAIVS